MNQKTSKKESFKVTLEIFPSEGQDFDFVEIEDMLANVVSGMIRQYDLKKVAIPEAMLELDGRTSSWYQALKEKEAKNQ